LRQAFVKAFFLDLDLYFEKHNKNLRLELILAIKIRLKSQDEAERREKKSLIHASKALQEILTSLKKSKYKRPGEESKA